MSHYKEPFCTWTLGAGKHVTIVIALTAALGGYLPCPWLVAPTAAQSGAAKVAYPVKGRNIAIIVPFSPGGTSDLSARIYAAELKDELDIPVQVVNKPGAGLQVGMTTVTGAKPDGYTIGMATFPSISLGYLDPEVKSPYGRKDFVPIAAYVSTASALVVKADSPIKTVADLVQLAKARAPRQNVTVGTGGFLSGGHLAVAMLRKETRIEMTLVHFKGGAPAAIALLGGHIDVACSVAGVFQQQVSAGALRYLAYLDMERTATLPNVPTAREQGYSIDASTKLGFVVRSETPRGIVEALEAAIKKISAKPEVQEKILRAGMDTQFMGAAQLAAYWDNIDKHYGELISLAREDK